MLVPSYANWFKFDQIHQLEKKAMAEWFSGDCASKTQKTYVECRDFIVNLYRESPNRYLTATECRRHLAADVCAVLRLHNFLEHWGLINYNITTHDRPVCIGPMDSSGHPVLLAMPDGSLVPKESVGSGAGGGADATVTPGPPAAQLGTRPNIFAGGVQEGEEVRQEIRCTVTGEECSRERYHFISKPELVISPSVYESGNLPSGYTALDFVKVVGDKGGVKTEAGEVVSDWTETETLRLLEALEQFGEDWVQVAQHVGSKTKEQCIMHFLRLPIEDRYLDEQETEWGAGERKGEEEGRLGASNHVMAHVAFLCQSISPDLADKATNAAFQVLSKAGMAQSESAEEGAEGASKEPEGQSAADLQRKAQNCTALAAAALKARSMALTEEKEIQRLVGQVVKRQMDKLQMKIRNFEKLEKLLQVERDALQKHKVSATLSKPPPS